MDTGIKGSFLRTVFEGGGSGLFIIWLLAYSTLLQDILTDFSGGTSFLLVVLLTAIQVMASLLYLAGVRHQLTLLWLVTTALQTVYLVYLWIAVSGHRTRAGLPVRSFGEWAALHTGLVVCPAQRYFLSVERKI